MSWYNTTVMTILIDSTLTLTITLTLTHTLICLTHFSLFTYLVTLLPCYLKGVDYWTSWVQFKEKRVCNICSRMSMKSLKVAIGRICYMDWSHRINLTMSTVNIQSSHYHYYQYLLSLSTWVISNIHLLSCNIISNIYTIMSLHDCNEWQDSNLVKVIFHFPLDNFHSLNILFYLFYCIFTVTSITLL